MAGNRNHYQFPNEFGEHSMDKAAIKFLLSPALKKTGALELSDAQTWALKLMAYSQYSFAHPLLTSYTFTLVLYPSIPNLRLCTQISDQWHKRKRQLGFEACEIVFHMYNETKLVFLRLIFSDSHDLN